jgi:hypothetical protein
MSAVRSFADRLRRAPLARLYLWLVVPFGLFFVFFNPPFGGVPDELTHYFKALALAQGQVLPGPEASAPKNYVYLRLALVPIAEEEGRWPPVDGANVRANLTTRASAESAPVPSRVGFAYPFGYVPQAVGLWLGLRTHAPPLVAFYLARLLTFAAAVALVHAAIRTAPFGKLVFVLVGLLPITVQQLASLSYDALHLGAVLLFTAYVLALSQDPRPISGRERATVLLGSLCGSLLKPGFTLIALLVFVLPRERFRSRRAYWTFTLGTLFVGVLALVIGKLVFNEAATGTNVDPAAQLRHVVTHPLAFLGAVVRTVYLSSRIHAEGLVFLPGRMTDSLPPLFYIVTWVSLILLVRSVEDVVRLTRGQRLVLLGTGVAQALLVFLSLYLVSTAVGKAGVGGVQSRYMLGLMPLFVLPFSGASFRFRSDWIRRNPNVALLAGGMVLAVYVGWSVWKLYYY